MKYLKKNKKTWEEKTFLPILKLPSEKSIYSAIVFVIEMAKNADEGLSIVARLGCSNTTIRFLQSIAKMMRGSEFIAVVYSENSLEHMMSHEAVSRALKVLNARWKL